MLLQLKKRWRSMSSKAAIVLVRRLRRLAQHEPAVLARGAPGGRPCGRTRVRSSTSDRNGSPSRGEPARGCAGRAPRRGCPSSTGTGSGSRAPAARRACPEVASDVYTSPCPGGAHSSAGSAGHVDRLEVVRPQLRHLALHEVERQAVDRQLGVAARAPRACRRGCAKLFISSSGMRAPCALAQVQHLARDHVEEGQPVLDLDQRLRPASSPCWCRARR